MIVNKNEILAQDWIVVRESIFGELLGRAKDSDLKWWRHDAIKYRSVMANAEIERRERLESD